MATKQTQNLNEEANRLLSENGIALDGTTPKSEMSWKKENSVRKLLSMPMHN